MELSKIRPLHIAGPCSAETEAQVLETARRLKNTGKIHLFRAGIWKPRTRPGHFEGVGAIGLPWLNNVQQELGLPVCVEVANAQHVDLALKANIDVLWIGARTTVNPFAVEEIAESLRGVSIPVMIKNPLNPDLDLWIGGIERLLKAGLTNIAAIHRGFSFAGEKVYRNRPQWQIAIGLKQFMKELPIIIDPSHICGRRDLLLSVAQMALDLDYDGTMIETHIDPDNAWSDAKQQITPEVYGDLIQQLVFRKPGSINEQSQIQQLRKDIDLLDEEILTLIANRMRLSEAIGQYKKEHNMTILQAERWSHIYQQILSKGQEMGLTPSFLVKLLQAIHDESIEHQERVYCGR